MPLTFAKVGACVMIKKVNGRDESKRYLESLGFIEGETVTIVNEIAGNCIINVKNTRVALDKTMASRIIV